MTPRAPRHTPIVITTLASLVVCGCATAPPGLDPALEARAERLPVFGHSMGLQPPNVSARLGRVHSLSCHFRWPLQQRQSDAVAKLRIKALAKGADGVIGLRLTLITNPKSPCNQGYEASGVAVKFETADSGPGSR